MKKIKLYATIVSIQNAGLKQSTASMVREQNIEDMLKKKQKPTNLN